MENLKFKAGRPFDSASGYGIVPLGLSLFSHPVVSWDRFCASFSTFIPALIYAKSEPGTEIQVQHKATQNHSSERVTEEFNTNSMADGPHLHQMDDKIPIYGRTFV
jgi:hypothetical protein